MTPREVTLTAEQTAHAVTIARRRQAEAERQGCQGKHGGHTSGADSLRDHYLGMIGEVAVAVILGHPLPETVNTFKAPDLPGRIQVRCRSKHTYELIVRPVDDNDDVFVHATTEDRRLVRVWGWLLGRDAKLDRWLQTHGGRAPAYFIAPQELHPLRELMPASTPEPFTDKMINWSFEQ